jgi:hypothetical protein
MGSDGFIQDGVMALECSIHGIGMLLPEFGAPLYIGK